MGRCARYFYFPLAEAVFVSFWADRSPFGTAYLIKVPPSLPKFSCPHLPPGTRLGLAVSGGSDSVALLRLGAELAGRAGWILTVLHIDHGLRGDASAADAAWVEALAGRLELPVQVLRGSLPDVGLEDAGRQLRYGWFRQLLAGELDAVATGHTLDDQAETVLAHLLRGAWTAGLGGIHPIMRAADLPGDAQPSGGVVVRPLLGERRAALRTWLGSLGQDWREDETNTSPAFTRNRIRHRLLPALSEFNPQASEHLAQVSVLAREDESWWQAEVERILPDLLLPGRAVRGGGRASSTLPGMQSLAMEVARLRALHPALGRRVLRAAAGQLGVSVDFKETDRLLTLLEGPAGSTARREQLTAELRAERTARELRFVLDRNDTVQADEIPVSIPGEASGFGVRLRVDAPGEGPHPPATLRAARPSDRVRLRHSSGAPKRIKEVLERMGIAPPARAGWPVLEWQGEIVWMRGCALEPTAVSLELRVMVVPDPA